MYLRRFDRRGGGTTLYELPPPVREEEFRAVNTDNQEQIKTYFEPFVERLHSFLNETSCLHDIQTVRQMRVRAGRHAFGRRSFKAQPGHWYTRSSGGRKEAQFNVGLFPEYLRIGLGFEFTKGRYGSPDVQTTFGEFRNALARNRQAFERLVQDNLFRVEWVPKDQTVVNRVQTQGVTRWLLRPKPSDWIFIGRLLYKREDAEILEDPARLGEVMDSVFGELKPWWKEAQERAAPYLE